MVCQISGLALSKSEPAAGTEESICLCVKPKQHQVDALLYIMGEQAEEIYATFTLSEENSKKFDAVVEQFHMNFIPRPANEPDSTPGCNKMVSRPKISSLRFTRFRKIASSVLFERSSCATASWLG
ncbi:hypothetical protein MRX96_051893 [Rhipicephalus microplus]